MIQTNNRINNNLINILKNLINKKLDYISHQPFTFTNTSYGAVYLSINKNLYILTDYYHDVKKIGCDEEMSYIDFKSVSKIISTIHNVEFIKETLNLTINKIELVNTRQTALDTITNNSYEFLDTYGIIFTFDDNYQLAFEKDDLGENISIYRGYNLKDKFSYLEKYLTEEYDDDLIMSASIEFEEL